MKVYYCDRCGKEMNGRAGDARFIAMQDEVGLSSVGRTMETKIPPELGVPFSLAGRKAVILHICGDCGKSLLTWVATP